MKTFAKSQYDAHNIQLDDTDHEDRDGFHWCFLLTCESRLGGRPMWYVTSHVANYLFDGPSPAFASLERFRQFLERYFREVVVFRTDRPDASHLAGMTREELENELAEIDMGLSDVCADGRSIFHQYGILDIDRTKLPPEALPEYKETFIRWNRILDYQQVVEKIIAGETGTPLIDIIPPEAPGCPQNADNGNGNFPPPNHLPAISIP